MSSKSGNDTTKYWRTGIAIPVARKKTFDANLAAMGLKTVGDLVVCVTMANEQEIAQLAAALKPVIERRETERGAPTLKKELLDELKGMSPEELQRLVQLSKTQAA